MPRKKKADAPDQTPEPEQPEPAEEPKEVGRHGNVITLSLPAKLTEEQKIQYGDRQAAIQVELNSLKTAKDEYLADYRDQVEPLEKERNELADKLYAGEELREVECRLHYDLDSNMACYMRLDNGDVAHTRAIRTEELEAARQGALPMDPGA